MPSDQLSFGDAERRSFRNSYLTPTGQPPEQSGTLSVKGHASVFGSPSVEMKSNHGTFIEYIDRHAFDAVLRTQPDVILTWDHDTSRALARTGAGTLELRTDDRGLRYFARMSDTSYARDVAVLMKDGILTGSSFLFTVAPGGEEWRIDSTGTVVRTVTQVGALYDVCLTACPAYPAADSALARSFALAYATSRGYLTPDPDLHLLKAKARALLKT